MFAFVFKKPFSRVKLKAQTRENERDETERVSCQFSGQPSTTKTTRWLLLDGQIPNLKAIVYNQDYFATFCLWNTRQIGVRA